jgi:DNA modification methylase
MTATKLEAMALSALTPAQRNPKKHALPALRDSIGRFGYVEPIVLDERTGRLVAGHGRAKALSLMKAKGGKPPAGVAEKDGEWLVPVLRGWASRSDQEAEAYLVASNRLTEAGGYDTAALAEMLKELAAQNALEGTGFDADSIDAVIAQASREAGETVGLTDEDEVPEVVEPRAKTGDVWLLGRHRLMCGDSTKAEDVARLLAEAKPHLMVTDPPYGVEYDPNWRNGALDEEMGKVKLKVGKGGRALGVVLNDDRADWTDAWALFPGDVAYVWHASTKTHIVAQSLAGLEFEMRALIVWGKDRIAIGRGHYHHQHEPCWYAVRKGGTGHWEGDRKQTTLWSIAKPQKSETGHSTQKPVECMKRPILNNSRAGDAVYEPFSGSGTTLIAAEETGRACYAMELNPAYVDIAVARWEAFTGRKAEKLEAGHGA